MRKAKALKPVAKPKPKATHKGPHHVQPAAPPHSTGGASHVGPITAPPAHHARPGRPHHPAKPKRPKRKQPVRKLASPGLLVACCSAEALAMSLRLAGGAVTDDDVLALYFATANGPDDGVSIAATLEAARRYGLADTRSVQSVQCSSHVGWPEQYGSDAHPMYQASHTAGCWQKPPSSSSLGDAHFMTATLVLGLDLPEGPHAVLATPEGWWSWGELYPPSAFSGAVIGEAWAVTW